MAEVRRAAVIGTGTMGPGMGAVLARAGIETALYDVSAEVLSRGLDGIRRSLAKAVEKGKLTAENAAAAGARIHTAS